MVNQQDKNFKLTKDQQEAFNKMLQFITDKEAKIFILKGYAGTGKTTMLRKLIEELEKREERFSLLASTGRAAKILSNATGMNTRTVHSEIYKFTDLNQNLEEVASDRETNKVDSTGQLFLNFELTPKEYSDNNTKNYYYIVDEASMISDIEDKTATQAMFGSGRLLMDLINYDKLGKFIFVGDFCQLPPVTQDISPALSAKYLTNEYQLKVYEAELTQIVRQEQDNDITLSAQRMRKLYHSPQPWKWAKFPMLGFKNIHVLGSQTELISRYITQVNNKGYNAATLLCFSNKQCDLTTQILRPSFGHFTPLIEKGDLLLVTQNNMLSGLMNGDLVTVNEVVIKERRAGLTFLKVSVKELFTGKDYSQLMIADILYGTQTNLTQSQQKELFIDFYYRMKEKSIKQGSKLFQEMMVMDPYLNALRAVFGYALTCHKAQGGEWDYVYLDIPKSVPGMQKPYVYQWIYTAMTRARKELYIVDGFWLM